MWYSLVFALPLCNGLCESDYSLSTSTFGFFQTCRSNHIKQALQKYIMCKPSLVFVKLPLPNNTDVQQVIRKVCERICNKLKHFPLHMTPTHIEVLQCSGACHRNNQGCVATTKLKKIPVMLGKCDISKGKCEKE